MLRPAACKCDLAPNHRSSGMRLVYSPDCPVHSYLEDERLRLAEQQKRLEEPYLVQLVCAVVQSGKFPHHDCVAAARLLLAEIKGK